MSGLDGTGPRGRGREGRRGRGLGAGAGLGLCFVGRGRLAGGRGLGPCGRAEPGEREALEVEAEALHRKLQEVEARLGELSGVAPE